MKKFMFILVFISFLVSNIYAKDITPFSVGPYLFSKVGINTNTTPNFKNFLNFNRIPDFGASLYVPFSEVDNIGIWGDLGYYTYSYGITRLKYDNNQGSSYRLPDTDFLTHISYIGFSTYLNSSGFIIGFNFGIPLKGTIDNFVLGHVEQPDRTEYKYFEDYSIDIKSSDLNFLIEIRAGGIIPLFSNELGTLNLVIMGGYALTRMISVEEGAYKNYMKEVKDVPWTKYEPEDQSPLMISPKTASLSIGLNYMFTLIHDRQ